MGLGGHPGGGGLDLCRNAWQLGKNALYLRAFSREDKEVIN